MGQRTSQRVTDIPTKPRFFLNQAFGLLWSGQSISMLGSQVTSAGLPFIAILLLRAQPLQIGLLMALSAVPNLLFSLFIGVWVDRLSRRLVMLLADLVRALLLFGLPLAALYGLLHMELLYVVTILLSCCNICFDTAYQAFLPQIVTHAQLVEGNSRLGTSSSLAEIGGPPLAGMLVPWIGAPLSILCDALSFLVSALSIALIRSREVQSIVPVEKREPLWRELYAGYSVLCTQPVLRKLAIYTTMRTFFGGTFAALYTIYIVRELSFTPALYGVLVALGGVGALIGALTMPRLTRRFGVRQILIGGAFLHGCLALLTPLASGPVVLVFCILGISQLIGDIGFELYTLNEISLLQGSVSVHMQGRVSATMAFLVGGIAPLGTLLAGVVSEYVSIRMTLFCGSVGMLVCAIWLALVLRRDALQRLDGSSV